MCLNGLSNSRYFLGIVRLYYHPQLLRRLHEEIIYFEFAGGGRIDRR
jgi:hypothetical protein